MQTLYRTWAPEESPVRIEYSTRILRELLRESADRENRGTLFGVRHGTDVRVSTCAKAEGLEPVGIFAVRVRGEVFLTESDLERFTGEVALVVAGGRAGFFVREKDGSVQTVQSYQEFPVEVDPPVDRRRFAPWIVTAILVILTLAIVSRVNWRPAEHLTVQTEAGQLLIAWNPAALSKNAKLEIIDGVEETTLPIASPLASATYVPHRPDTELRVFLVNDRGRPGQDTVLFLRPAR